jgi:(4-(4-[2-(gamma-L-glutamylamino)ethyl]phenoxymethyl)furan-2-yl)methanamine synthase
MPISDTITTGWDLGGAHLKVAQIDGAGRLMTAQQLPCTLWRGLEHLTEALAAARRQLLPSTRHGITMTGELTDLFVDRADGVRQLAEAMVAAFTTAELSFYAGPAGFVPAAAAIARPREIASANWHASVRFAASRVACGLFLDVGSTTTDIVPFRDGAVDATGYSDDERMVAGELVYTGVTRTPVMALADRVPFAGEIQPLMAEYFATAADLHRLTGALPDDADQLPSADGRGKTLEESARRLARMLGRDYESAPLTAWQGLSRHLAERQLRLVHDAADRILSRGLLPADAPVLGAGIGRFLVRDLAARLARPYVDFASLVAGEAALCEWAARCAPAASIAALMAAGA